MEPQSPGPVQYALLDPESTHRTDINGDSITQKPTRYVFLTLGMSLLGTVQYGWLLSQLNLRLFHDSKECSAVPVAPGTCVIFPGHTDTQWLFAISAWIVGGMCGALLSGPPAEKFGRKLTLVGNVFVMIIGALMQSFDFSIYFFIIGRFLSGIASGSTINVTSILASEISPPSIRGTMESGLQAGVSFGSLLVTSCHYIMDGANYQWRLLMVFPIAIGIIQFCLVYWTLESPTWLLANNRQDEAIVNYIKLYQTSSGSNIQASVDSFIAQYGTTIPNAGNVEHEHTEENACAVNNCSEHKWLILFSQKYRKQLMLAIILCGTEQLCGIDAIFYYSSSIFHNAGIEDPRIGNTIVNVVRFSFVCFATIIMDRVTRRMLLRIGFLIMILSSVGMIVALTITNAFMSMLSTAIFVAAFCISIGPMAWMITAEIFPSHLHAPAGSLGTSVTWLSNLIVGVSYPSLADALGSYAFSPFLVILILVLVYLELKLPETGQKTYADIEAAFEAQAPKKETVRTEFELHTR